MGSVRKVHQLNLYSSGFLKKVISLLIEVAVFEKFAKIYN